MCKESTHSAIVVNNGLYAKICIYLQNSELQISGNFYTVVAATD